MADISVRQRRDNGVVSKVEVWGLPMLVKFDEDGDPPYFPRTFQIETSFYLPVGGEKCNNDLGLWIAELLELQVGKVNLLGYSYPVCINLTIERL